MTTSQINPNLIDSTYPVAGQDNNTKGFRDNFSAIKDNFQFAENEINGLLANSISFGGNNDLEGAVLYNVELRNEKCTVENLGNVSGNTSINYQSGSYKQFFLTGNANPDINYLPSGAVLTLQITPTASSNIAEPYTISFPNIVGTGIDNSGLIGLVGNTLSFPRSNSTTLTPYTYQFISYDNGNRLVVNPINTMTQPLNASSEDLAASANVNLGVSDSYFSTSGAETATLPAGVNGQVKVLAMYATSGNMVITVENAGWKTSGSGTVTFDTIGDACTLKYINNKWFCIGNNGCTFA